MSEQHYENYWSITNAFTDYNGSKFLTTLKICVNFIDEFHNEPYSEEKYERLQERVNVDGLNPISIRKRINQLVKLGFINSYLISYPVDSLKYLEAKTNRRRQSLLSKIVYTNARLNASVKEESNIHQINFLLKTIEEVGKLRKNDIIGLMNVNITDIEKGYLSKQELFLVSEKAQEINFEDRKYNQISHFWNLLSKLDDLVIIKNELYFEDDAKVIFGEDLKKESKKRDSYLHRLYKNQLKEESYEKLGEIKCMLEKLSYPSLVASHIKPFIDSEKDEAYEPNNGLLLSRNMDILFDQGYISFKDNGTIVCSDRLNQDMLNYLQNYTLDITFLNRERLQYLHYHREKILKNK